MTPRHTNKLYDIYVLFINKWCRYRVVGQHPASKEECKSITDVLESFDFLSTFREAVARTGLADAFNRIHLNATLLIPSDGVSEKLESPFPTKSKLRFSSPQAKREGLLAQ